LCSYQDILRALHLHDSTNVPANNTDRFIKLGKIRPDIIQNFKAAIVPGEFLCIDETLLAFKGRLSFLQYNPKKRTRFGIKQFLLCDCSLQFVVDILPYQGKSTIIADRDWIKDVGFGGAAVLSLLQNHLGRGHKVILDNWFMSPKLVMMLQAERTYVLETVQRRRKGMPQMQGKLKKGEIEIYSTAHFLVERYITSIS
jgi:hypothetical protein